jgi:hypothetical protein
MGLFEDFISRSADPTINSGVKNKHCEYVVLASAPLTNFRAARRSGRVSAFPFRVKNSDLPLPLYNQGWIYTYPDGFSSSIPLGVLHRIAQEIPVLPSFPDLTRVLVLFLNFLSLNTKPEVSVPSASSLTQPEENFHLEPSDYYLRASLIPPPLALIISIR